MLSCLSDSSYERKRFQIIIQHFCEIDENIELQILEHNSYIYKAVVIIFSTESIVTNISLHFLFDMFRVFPSCALPTYASYLFHILYL